MQHNSMETLERKARWVRRETLRIHHRAPETRIASSLSDVEIFVALYYGGILRCDPADPRWEGRDRFIVSKGHGGMSLYPILADLGFFDRRHLARVCRTDSFLGAIPDMLVPGFETINGSLGQGLGVACGIAGGSGKRSRRPGSMSSWATASCAKAPSGRPSCSPPTIDWTTSS